MTSPAVIPFDSQHPTGEKNINPELLTELVSLKVLTSLVG